MKHEPSTWWQLARRPEVRTSLWILGFTGVIVSILIFTLLQAHAAEKTTWDWLKALILPAVVAALGTFGGAWFTRERSRETALQAYLDKMSELLIDKKIHEEYGRYADTRVTARARTLAVLSQLDGNRKSTVLLFLREARLINKQPYVREGRWIYPRTVGLRGADLSNACLRGIHLISTKRKEAVSLEGAILRGADLRCADLERADLRGADLRNADLRYACLRGVDADSSGETERSADLRGADLRNADLGVSEKFKKPSNMSGAKLSGANLQGANLQGANLSDAEITQDQLDACESLEGATMPDGSQHP
jgi:uncharacterized protein YjbI with pentapeptide repeats